MKSTKETQNLLKIELNDNSLKFKNFNEIYFPNNCIVCGEMADNRIEKSFYGTFTTNFEYKKNFYFSIPVCTLCKTNIGKKTGLKSKSGKLLLTSTILGVFLSIIAYFFTLSLFLSMGIVAISFIIPFRSHKQKIKSKIKFEDFLKIETNRYDIESVEFKFKDESYAKNLREINFAKHQKEEDNTTNETNL